MEKEKIEKNKKIQQLIIKILVSASLFSIIIWKVDEKEMFGRLAQMNVRYALIVVLLIILNYIVSAIRWRRLLVFSGTDKIKTSYMIYLYFTGSFFNNFMPTSIGGDVYKVLKLGKKINSTTNAFSATFMERFLGVIALGLIAVISFINLYGFTAVVLMFCTFLAGLIGISFLKVLAKKFKKVAKILDSIASYKDHKDQVLFAFIFSFAVQIISILSQYFVFASLGVFPPFIYSFFVLPLISLAGFIIPSLNGIGVQDSLYVSLFSVVGVSSATALSASLLFHIMRLVVSLFGGLMYAAGLDE